MEKRLLKYVRLRDLWRTHTLTHTKKPTPGTLRTLFVEPKWSFHFLIIPPARNHHHTKISYISVSGLIHFLQKEIKNNTRLNCFQNALLLELKAKQLKATEIVQSKIAQYYGCSVHFMLSLQYDT